MATPALGVAVTSKPDTAAPPSDAPGVHDTDTEPAPTIGADTTGQSGATVAPVVTALELTDGAPGPATFVALTRAT